MHWIAYKVFLMILICNARNIQATPTVYNAWTDTGIHLMMSDSGTPDNFEDDVVIDWEDNREFKITILD